MQKRNCKNKLFEERKFKKNQIEKIGLNNILIREYQRVNINISYFYLKPKTEIILMYLGIGNFQKFHSDYQKKKIHTESNFLFYEVKI